MNIGAIEIGIIDGIGWQIVARCRVITKARRRSRVPSADFWVRSVQNCPIFWRHIGEHSPFRRYVCIPIAFEILAMVFGDVRRNEAMRVKSRAKSELESTRFDDKSRSVVGALQNDLRQRNANVPAARVANAANGE